MKKRIVLCADDYGQALPISSGIVDLVLRRRLTAVSCLVNEPGWPSQAAALIPLRGHIDVGLHFNLTQGQAISKEYQDYYGLSFTSLPKLLLKSVTRRLRVDILEAECRAQLEAFVKALGGLPDYLDGHQHIHQFPLIREAIFKVYMDSLREAGAYMRLSYDTSPSGDMATAVKKWVVRQVAGSHFQQALDQYKIIYNHSFTGGYPFQHADRYREYFLAFLGNIQCNGIIMCHPGYEQEVASRDAIANARVYEYKYFSGEQFLQDCEDYGIELACFDRELFLS